MKEEKLKEAKRLYESANADQKYVLESLFPELKEINEEEIKKAMINFFKSERKEGDVVLHYGVNIESMIAWLEKQGETYTKKDVDDAYLEGMVCAKNELEKQGETSSVSVWHNVSEKPEELRELLCECESNDAIWHDVAFYHKDTDNFWSLGKQVGGVVKWAYIDNLLEKQGKSSDQIHYWTEEEIEPIISDYLRGAEHYGGMIARLRCLKPKSLEKQGEQKPIEWDVDDDDKFFFLKARLKDYEDCIIYDEELSMCQKNNVRETTKEFLKWLDSIKERIGG